MVKHFVTNFIRVTSHLLCVIPVKIIDDCDKQEVPKKWMRTTMMEKSEIIIVGSQFLSPGPRVSWAKCWFINCYRIALLKSK